MKMSVILTLIFWSALSANAAWSATTSLAAHDCRVILDPKLTVAVQTVLKDYEDGIFMLDNGHFRQHGFYDVYFWPLFPDDPEQRGFDQWLKIRKESGRPTHVLDLFGSGLFMSNHENVDSITGTRLKEAPIASASVPHGYSTMIGDLFREEPWIKLKEDLRARKIQSIDLVTMRPAAGLTLLEEQLLTQEEQQAYAVLSWDLVQKAYTYVNSDSGELFLQLPKIENYHQVYFVWADELNHAGVPTQIFQRKDLDGTLLSVIVRMKKLPTSPQELPHF